MGTHSPAAVFVWRWPLKKLGHCIHPLAPEMPIPTVSARMIHAEAYRRDCVPLGSRAMNHHAAPHVTPAKMHPPEPPKPEHPRIAHVIPPKTAKRRVGRTRSCAKSRLSLLPMATYYRLRDGMQSSQMRGPLDPVGSCRCKSDLKVGFTPFGVDFGGVGCYIPPVFGGRFLRCSGGVREPYRRAKRYDARLGAE
jgi:hypothetical protein